jgi:hypothetical protein
VATPGDPHAAPEQDPAAELTDEERARATRRLVRRLQWGGIVFLAVVILGTLPAALAPRWPELARAAVTAAWFVGPLLGIALLVFAALRLRR